MHSGHIQDTFRTHPPASMHNQSTVGKPSLDCMIRGWIQVPLEPLNGLLGTDCKYSEKKSAFLFHCISGTYGTPEKKGIDKGGRFPLA